MKKALSISVAFYSLAVLMMGLTAAATDAVSGATQPYSDGERGPLPFPDDSYVVLGMQIGLKSWAIEYDKNIFRGGEIDGENAAQVFNKWGVKTIISAAPSDKERDFCKRHKLTLVEIPFEKNVGPSKADLALLINTIKSGEGAFYMHCVGGTHRGGILGLAYRVHILKWPFDKALIEFGKLGGNLKDDHVMIEAVRKYNFQ